MSAVSVTVSFNVQVGKDGLASEVIVKMLEPFAKCLALTNDGRLKKEITTNVFVYIMKQSDVVLEEEMKSEGDNGEGETGEEEQEGEEEEKLAGAESGENGEAEQAASDREEDEDEDADIMGNDADDVDMDFDAAKDPRAGGVDVVLPQLRPDFSKLAEMMFQVASEKKIRPKNRNPMYKLVKRSVSSFHRSRSNIQLIHLFVYATDSAM